MFGVAPGGGEKYYEKGESFKIGQFHDLDTEAIIFSEILQQFEGELKMTKEVENLVNQCTKTNPMTMKTRQNFYNLDFSLFECSSFSE